MTMEYTKNISVDDRQDLYIKKMYYDKKVKAVIIIYEDEET